MASSDNSARDLRAVALALLAVGLLDGALVLGHAFPDVLSVNAFIWIASSLALFSAGHVFLIIRMEMVQHDSAKLGAAAVVLNLLPLLLGPPASVVVGYLIAAAGAAFTGSYRLFRDSWKSVRQP
jgi:hypothetical protein